jgi:hypothetical protein
MKGSTRLALQARATRPSVNSLVLIYGLPISSVNMDFFAANTSKLYCHSNESIFILLVVGSKCILMNDDNRNVMCTTSTCKIREHFADRRNEVGFSRQKLYCASARHDLVPFKAETYSLSAILQRKLFIVLINTMQS